jgi:hypothetical protein
VRTRLNSSMVWLISAHRDRHIVGAHHQRAAIVNR